MGTSAWRSRPHLARDTAGTLAEARRLWGQVDPANVMIKVPATPEGIPAIEQLISEGMNVNVTLLFAQEAYEQVAHAYISGLEKRAVQGGAGIMWPAWPASSSAASTRRSMP